MKMTSDSAAAGPIVTGFGQGGFKLGEVHHRAVLLTVDAAVPWSPPPLGELTVDALGLLIAARPEFILLGAGPSLRRPSSELVRALDALGLGLEVMDSRAAARAWGVLRGEGRQVAAALYPLD
jgi:uncharacterized protein